LVKMEQSYYVFNLSFHFCPHCSPMPIEQATLIDQLKHSVCFICTNCLRRILGIDFLPILSPLSSILSQSSMLDELSRPEHGDQSSMFSKLGRAEHSDQSSMFSELGRAKHSDQSSMFSELGRPELSDQSSILDELFDKISRPKRSAQPSTLDKPSIPSQLSAYLSPKNMEDLANLGTIRKDQTKKGKGRGRKKDSKVINGRIIKP
jgi:hypothetical protein